MGPVKELFLIFIAIIMLSESAAAVYVEIASAPAQITVDESANVSFRVLDINFTPQNNTLVNFTVTLGNLSTASAYTNSSGIATIGINSTAAGNAAVNASVGSVYNTINVTFIPGKPAFIDVNVTQNPLVVGNTTVVNLTAYDKYNNTNYTANLILNIQISDILGEIINQMNITRAPYTLTQLLANQSNVTLTNYTDNSSSVLLDINSTVAGNITLTAIAENTTGTFNITFTPAALSYISLDYYKEYTVNTSSNITVGAWDMYDNPIKDIAVIFNATPPTATKYNSPIEYNSLNLTPKINITNLNGFTSTVFRTDKRAGENIINITAGSINTSITIQGIADDASDLFLTHTPDAVYANNKDAYRLTAQVVDKFLNPVLPGSMPITKYVLFITSLSSTLVPLNESGTATTLVGPTPYIETVAIRAIYNNETGPTNIANNTNLSFVAGDLNRFVIYANPASVLSQNIKGNHYASIILTSLDEWGHPIPGINVTLNNTNTTLGNLTIAGINATDIINSTTDSNGIIQATFTSKTLAGNATIIASNGTINSSVVVSIRDSPFLSVSIVYEPNSINSGDKVNVTTVISVEGELPISRPAASAMLVLDTSGSMDPDYYAGTPLDILLVSDVSGSMNYTIGNTTKIGAVKTAEINFNNNLISNDRVGLLSFGGGISTPSLSYNITYINNQINAQSASGGTPTAKAIQNAKNYLLSNPRPGAQPYIILLSDGLPTEALDGTYSDPNPKATFEAISEANYAKNAGIKIYSIGFGTDADNATMTAIASPNSYYYAASDSQLQTIYYNIAQQISDFDITTRQYGIDGFTPYNYMKSAVVNGTWSDTIAINDIITDFKIQIDNPNLSFTLTSPNGTTYPRPTESGFVNRSGYYNSSNGRYIWITPVSGLYVPTDDNNNTVPTGSWNITVNGTGTFNITTYIDKKSAAKIASHTFISSFDPNRGDRAGLVTYSNHPNPPNITITNNQISYLRNGSIWDGYFTGTTPQKSYILNFTGKDCYRTYNNIGECYIVVNGAYVTSIPPNGLQGIQNYSVDITSFTQNGINSVYFYNYRKIYQRSSSANIKDVKIFENGNLIASYPSNWIALTADPTAYTFNATFNVTMFNLTWPNAADDLDLYLYQGTALINKSRNPSGFETVSGSIYAGTDYHVEVEGVNLSSETLFNITASQNLNWKQYKGYVASTLDNSSSSLDSLNNSIDTMTSIGLTAIDEGMYEANNELSKNTSNSTIVLMTDGLDNAGYHSILLESQRAKNNHTVIYTIGFGSNMSEIDPVLSEIANNTGGQYYFAPNTSVLQSIFRGIAANITNFTAEGPTLNLHIPHNYISGLALATATYVTNSSNATKSIGTNFTIPTPPATGNAEPNITTQGNISTLSWTLPNLNPGQKWGVWYQLTVQGAGYVPLILPTSNISYIDLNGTFITVNIIWSGGANLGGGGAGVNYIALGNMQLSANPPVIFTGETSRIMVAATYTDGNPAIANVTLYSNLGYFNNLQNPLNNMTVSGLGFVNFTSITAGQAHIDAIGSNGNNNVLDSVVVVVRPKGKITVS